MTENEIARQVVDAAYKIHYAYGPGLLELPYAKMMAVELRKRGLVVEREVPIPLIYEGERIDESFKADMIVNRKVILEFKATENMHAVFKRQLNTYLKVTNLRLGLVLNFGMDKIKDGIVRIINGQLEDSVPQAPQEVSYDLTD